MTTARTTARVPTPTPAPRSFSALVPLSLTVLLGYAAIRAWWLVAGPPPVQLSPIGEDLVAVPGWPAVVILLLGAAAAATLARLSRAGAALRRTIVALTAALGLLMIGSAAMLLLDVVALLFPGIGVELFPAGMASRAAMAGSGVLLLIGVRTQGRLVRDVCVRCGSAPRPARSPWWVYLAAYLTVLGCLVRLGAQLVVGFSDNPLAQGVMMHLFEVGFLLGGVLLPLALAHGWGRVWPFWVPFVARRRIPRWLVLGPGAGLGVGMVAYFAMMLAQMVMERLQGRNPFPPSGGLDLPEPFFWVSVPAYLLWGIGLVVAARSYSMITRPSCRRCGE